MSEQPKFLPRTGDLPRAELIRNSQRASDEFGHADVLFKFTCSWCGERCTLQEPNILYENGECFACGKTTKIDFGGYALHRVINKEQYAKKKIHDEGTDPR